MSVTAQVAILEEFNDVVKGLEDRAIADIQSLLKPSLKSLEAGLSKVKKKYKDRPEVFLARSARVEILTQEIATLGTFLTAKQEGQLEDVFSRTYKETQRQAQVTGDTLSPTRNDPTAIRLEGVSARRLAYLATDSRDRLKGHTETLRQVAIETIGLGLLQNSPMGKIKKELQTATGLTSYQSERIVRTETIGVSNSAITAQYLKNGLTYYVWIATADSRTCPYCVGRNTSIFELGKVEAPAHPLCRCFKIPFIPGVSDFNSLQDFQKAVLKEAPRDFKPLYNKQTPFEIKNSLPWQPPLWSPKTGFVDDEAKDTLSTAPTSERPIEPEEIGLEVSEVIETPAFDEYEEVLGYRSVKGSEYRFTIKGGNSDGTDTEVWVAIAAEGTKKSVPFSVDFKVNDLFAVVDGTVNKKANTLIANQISKIFRENVAAQPNGTRFMTTPAIGDSRGAFRESMYAKMGFSFAGGNTTPSLGKKSTQANPSQFGVVENGKLTPADKAFKAFKEEKAKEHKSSIRQAIKDAISKAREEQ
jgi:SPP1 gp7 family putative phage head morphogenesis protein